MDNYFFRGGGWGWGWGPSSGISLDFISEFNKFEYSKIELDHLQPHSKSAHGTKIRQVNR